MMSPEQREAYRWKFAGQALAGIIASPEYDGQDYYGSAIFYADNLISELEKTPAAQVPREWWVRLRQRSEK